MPLLTTAAGKIINWDDFGNESNPPLVLIQGFSAQMLGWHPEFCQRLAEAGFHVIRFDNRDVGRSEHYPNEDYGMADLADDTAALIDGLGLESAHIVGQSMGGMIAQYLAVNHRSAVRSLGLMYTSATLQHLIGASDAIDAVDALETGPQTREEFTASYVATEANCASASYPQDVRWLAELGGQMFDAGVDPTGIQRQLKCILGYTDRADDDRTITVPTAILAGDSDRLINHIASKQLHELIPGSTLRIFPGMGHEVPRALWNEIVALLGENARRADAIVHSS
jgi:pimeloyl-ACP methyl ester carboxylesterase